MPRRCSNEIEGLTALFGFALKVDHARFVSGVLATKKHKKLKNQQDLFELFVLLCGRKRLLRQSSAVCVFGESSANRCEETRYKGRR